MCGGSLQLEYPILSLLMLSPIHLLNWWWKSIHTGCNQKDRIPQDDADDDGDDDDDDDHNKLFTVIATRTDSLWQTPTWLLQADFHWRRLWGKMPFAQWLNSDLMYQQFHNAQLHYERYVDFLTWCTLSSLSELSVILFPLLGLIQAWIESHLRCSSLAMSRVETIAKWNLLTTLVDPLVSRGFPKRSYQANFQQLPHTAAIKQSCPYWVGLSIPSILIHLALE